MNEKLEWRVHTTGLLKELLGNPECSTLKTPLNIFRQLLCQVAKRSIELNDLQLNKLMIRLGLYARSNPEDPEYNAEFIENYLKK